MYIFVKYFDVLRPPDRNTSPHLLVVYLNGSLHTLRYEGKGQRMSHDEKMRGGRKV